MNNKNKTSFIDIVKRIKKDQLIVLLLLGVLLLVIAMPAEESGVDLAYREKDNTESQVPVKSSGEGDSYEEELSEKLELLLSQADGVGEVSVMIQVKGSSERVIEKDEPFTERVSNDRTDAGTAGSSRETAREETTVYEETDDGRQVPYVVKENAPEIQGVVIVAQGGDRPVVVQNIMEAVQALLQIEVHKIKVLKMK